MRKNLPMHRVFILLLITLSFVSATKAEPNENTYTNTSNAVSIIPSEINALEKQINNLKNQVLFLENSKAIKRLQRSYSYYMDAGMWVEAAQLFTSDATFEFGNDGVYRGNKSIKKYLATFINGQWGVGIGKLNSDILFMPVITFSDNGVSAKARWTSIMLIGTYGEKAFWGQGVYENEYIKENNNWKIAKLHFYQKILVPYVGGWAKNKDANQGVWVSDEFPADSPPSIPLAFWPESLSPPYHFENKVVPSRVANQKTGAGQ